MTDIYRSEILAVVIQQIMDEPVLPVLFLRTVIQAVTTYKSLVPLVATTLLSRLITKKIWTNAPLWEGFVRCAKVSGDCLGFFGSRAGAVTRLPDYTFMRYRADERPHPRSLRLYPLAPCYNCPRTSCASSWASSRA